MAVSVLGYVTSFANNGNNATANLSALGLQEGDVLVVSSAAPRVTGATPGILDGAYTVIVTRADSNTNGPSIGAWWKRMPATPDGSVTVSGDTSNQTDTTIIVVALRGVEDTGDIVVDWNTNAYTGNPVSGNTVTGLSAGDVTIIFVNMAEDIQDTTIYAPTGYSPNGTNPCIIQVGSDTVDHTHFACYKVATSDGDETPGSFGGTTTGHRWYSITVAIAAEPPAIASSNKPIYLKGRDTSTDNQPIFTKGSSTSVDNQPIFTKGVSTIADNQAIFLTALIGITDTQSIYLRGQSTTSDTQSIYLDAEDSLTDTQSIYLKGLDTLADTQAIYINAVTAGTDIDDTQAIYIKSSSTSTNNQAIYIKGSSTLSGSQPIYLAGQSSTANTQAIYLKGLDIISDTQSIYLKSSNTLSDSQPIYLNAESVLSDSQPIYLNSDDTLADTQSIYLAGTSISVIDIQGNEGHLSFADSANAYARAIGYATPTSDVELILKFKFGDLSSGGVFRAFIRGSADWNDWETPTTAYEVAINNTGNYLVNRIQSGSRTQIGSQTQSIGTGYYWLKFQAVGTQIRAKIWSDGTKQYWKDGKLHRDKGPAVIHANGYKAYWKDGKKHRDKGPAIIRSDGGKEYWKDGIRILR